MNKFILLLSLLLFKMPASFAQSPCSDLNFRQLDFWIGDWDVYGKNDQKAGKSKITLIFDSCVILEEWESAAAQQNLVFKGKSFNSYNTVSKQWQQTWTDNTGNTTEFLRGVGSDGKVTYYADKVAGADNKYFMRRLTFTKLSADKVRQFGERSDDQGVTWKDEYNLEYRRHKN